MVEDQLTRDERIRLECLAQVNLVMHGDSIQNRINAAKQFEAYIKGASDG